VPPANFVDWSDGTVLAADHEALPIADIPPVWRTCIVFLEDREFDRVSRLLGIDPLAVLKSGWQTLTGDRRRGASTLYMQVVRTLRGRSPDQNEAVSELALRKAAELFGAHALVRSLSSGDPHAAERFVAMHLPFVIGAKGSGFGEPVHGIGLASRLLFGVPASSLSPEGQAILAAAVKVPVLMAPPTDSHGQALAEARWKRLKERADFCLRSVPGLPPDEIAKMRGALAVMPLPVPRIDSGLEGRCHHAARQADRQGIPL
jgi:membrane peptidoglycan carboxypeptidase